MLYAMSLVLHGSNLMATLRRVFGGHKKGASRHYVLSRWWDSQRVLRVHKKEFPAECKTLGKNLTKPDFSLWSLVIRNEGSEELTRLFYGV